MSGSSRMPKELTLGPQEYRRIQETSRWQVELDMIMANCEELDPEMKKETTRLAPNELTALNTLLS